MNLAGLGDQTVPSELGEIPFDIIRDYMNSPYYRWAPSDSTNPNSLFDDLAVSLGSTEFPRVMTNLQRILNVMKALVWNTYNNPSSDEVFKRLAHPTIANTRAGLQLLRDVSHSVPSSQFYLTIKVIANKSGRLLYNMTVFNYLNHATVKGLLGMIHQKIYQDLRNFDVQYNSYAGATQQVHSADLWVKFIGFWMDRMINHFVTYANGRIIQLRSGWQTRIQIPITREYSRQGLEPSG